MKLIFFNLLLFFNLYFYNVNKQFVPQNLNKFFESRFPYRIHPKIKLVMFGINLRTSSVCVSKQRFLLKGLKLPAHCKKEKTKNPKKIQSLLIEFKPNNYANKKAALKVATGRFSILASQLIYSVKYARVWLFSNQYFLLQ